MSFDPTVLLAGQLQGESYKVETRDALVARINELRADQEYYENDFVVKKTWLPREELSEHRSKYPNGVVWVIPESHDEMKVARDNSCEREIRMGVLFQRSQVDANNDDLMDGLDLIVEQLQETARLFNPSDTSYPLNWLRTEFLKDDEEQRPFNFMVLKEQAVFEAYFTAYYKHVTK